MNQLFGSERTLGIGRLDLILRTFLLAFPALGSAAGHWKSSSCHPVLMYWTTHRSFHHCLCQPSTVRGGVCQPSPSIFHHCRHRMQTIPIPRRRLLLQGNEDGRVPRYHRPALLALAAKAPLLLQVYPTFAKTLTATVDSSVPIIAARSWANT